MKQAVICHGWGGTSESNWLPWLRQELEKGGWRVVVPDFPDTEQPQLTAWLKHFDQHVSLDEETVLIGHSLGVPLILRALARLPAGKRVKAAVLVAGFHRSLGEQPIENFVEQPFEWEKIRACCGRFVVINSDDDPYVPLEIGRELAEKLGVALIVEHGGGHLNAPGGSLEYPRVLEVVTGEKPR